MTKAATVMTWCGRSMADMSKRELLEVIEQLVKAQQSELEYVRQSRDKWMKAAFEQARAAA